MLAPSARFTRLAGAAAALLAAWAALVLHGEGLARSAGGGELGELALRFAPLLAVLALGLYAVLRVAYRVLTFRTVPAEGVALREDIREAKVALGKLGVE